MSFLKKSLSILFVGLLIGVGVGVSVSQFMPNFISGSVEPSAEDSTPKEPLYWVAPMDANYRRDQPGLSPMGMDLVPVYAEEQSDSGPGTVTISPNIVNNLGVRTAVAVKHPLHSEIHTVGYVQYDQDQLLHIHPRVEGWIETLHVKAAGDPVKQGEPLYTLYSPQLVNAQEELVLALNRKNQNLVRAAEERLSALRLSQEFIDRLKRTKKVQQTVVFFTSRDGVVDNLNVREGFFVKPGTTLMSIGNLVEVWVEAEIFESQAALVELGQPVSMTLGYLPGKKWQGTVDYIYPTVDPKTRALRVRLRFRNQEEALKPNMFAQIVIHAQSVQEKLIVPASSVIRTGGQARLVLSLGEGRFKSVYVAIGQVTPDSVEIISGIQEGDRVVTSAQFLLDSESSISSDFKRMYHDENGGLFDIPFANVNGVVKSVDASARIVNIHRDAIPKWDRPAAAIDFVVSSEIDIHLFDDAKQINFTFEIQGGEFVIVHVQPSYERIIDLNNESNQ